MCSPVHNGINSYTRPLPIEAAIGWEPRFIHDTCMTLNPPAAFQANFGTQAPTDLWTHVTAKERAVTVEITLQTHTDTT